MADIKSQLNEALDAFASDGALAERSRLSPILTTSGAAVATKDPRFLQGLDKIIASFGANAENSIEALAFAWRATSVTSMREHRRHLIQHLISGAICNEFPDLPSRMPDPEDRRHFADALYYAPGSWKPRYLARAIAAEREGEKARESLCRAFLTSFPVLADEISLVTEALASERIEQLDPQVGRARRAASILDAFASAMWASETEIDPGLNLGEELSKFAISILLLRPMDRLVSAPFAASLVNYVVVATRLHGSLAADPKTYSFLGPLKRAFGTSDWPEMVQGQMLRASAQVLDQLLLLVRLGMPDVELRRVFISLVGEVPARLRLNSAAAREHGLDQEGAHWLVNGSARRQLATERAVAETALSSIDATLALAVRDAEIVELGFKQLQPDLQSAAEFHSSALASRFSQTMDRVERLTGAVRSVAQKRGLTLKGTPGEVVTFNPVEHEPGSEAIGERTVRLITRAVERVVDGKPVGIVMKGDVGKA